MRDEGFMGCRQNWVKDAHDVVCRFENSFPELARTIYEVSWRYLCGTVRDLVRSPVIPLSVRSRERSSQPLKTRNEDLLEAQPGLRDGIRQSSIR